MNVIQCYFNISEHEDLHFFLGKIAAGNSKEMVLHARKLALFFYIFHFIYCGKGSAPV